MTLTVELKKEYALRIPEDLPALDAIRFQPASPYQTVKLRAFQAVNISTKGN